MVAEPNGLTLRPSVSISNQYFFPASLSVLSTERRELKHTNEKLVAGTLAVETSVLQYMKDHGLYGFGRQSRVERLVMVASERCSAVFSEERRWVLLAGTAALVAAGGLMGVISRLRKGGAGGGGGGGGCAIR